MPGLSFSTHPNTAGKYQCFEDDVPSVSISIPASQLRLKESKWSLGVRSELHLFQPLHPKKEFAKKWGSPERSSTFFMYCNSLYWIQDVMRCWILSVDHGNLIDLDTCSIRGDLNFVCMKHRSSIVVIFLGNSLSLFLFLSLSTKYIGAIWRDPPLNEGFGQIGFLGGKGLPYLGRNHVALFHHNVLALPGQTVGADDIRTENKTDKLSSQAAFLAVDGGDARISQRASQYQMRTSQNQMRSAKKNRQHWVHRHLHLWYRHVGHVGHVGQSLGTPHLQLGDMCHSSFFWTCFSLTPLLPGDWKCSIRDFKTHLFFIVLLYLSYCRLYRFGRPKWKLWALHRRAALARCKWR